MSIRKLVYTALFTALIIVLTCLVVIPIGVNGYINLSDLLIMLLSGYLDIFGIFFVAGVGCMLADIFLGYSSYAIFTLVIKGFEGILMTYLIRKKIIKFKPIIFVVGGLFMMLGYGLTDAFLANDLKMIFPSMIANAPQAFICILIASLVDKPFSIIGRKINESKEY